MEDALRVASSPHDFKLLVAAEGRTATSMSDIVDQSAGGNAAGPVTLKRPSPPVPAGAGSNGSQPPPS